MEQHEGARLTIKDMPKISKLGRDLLVLTASQKCGSLLLPLASAITLGICVSYGWPLASLLAAAAYTFYSYGSTSHDLVHSNLGLSRRRNHVFLSLIELIGMRSGHAYMAAHLHHHVQFPHLDDVEGNAAHGTLFRALLSGPLHQVRIWWWAVRYTPRFRTWIISEGAACLVILFAAIVVWPITHAPLVYVALVVMGSWAFPLMTAYLPHNSRGDGVLHQTRRFRGIVAAVLFRQHLYHLEHHLYPAVPHQNWPQLATRLDPYLDRSQVEPIVLGF